MVTLPIFLGVYPFVETNLPELLFDNPVDTQ